MEKIMIMAYNSLLERDRIVYEAKSLEEAIKTFATIKKNNYEYFYIRRNYGN